MDRDLAIAVLEAIAMAQAAEGTFDRDAQAALARELNLPSRSIEEAAAIVDRAGLAVVGGVDESLPPRMLKAGRQYLDRRGRVDGSALFFLPRVVDDLNAREALLVGGSRLVDGFAQALAEDRASEFAKGLVPEGFRPAITERLAVDLYAAAVALMVRLSSGDPAECVAEELVAVSLIKRAEAWLGAVNLTEEDRVAAEAELEMIFELFQDEDVLQLFRMREPGDAAVAGHEQVNKEMAVVDQRVEAWFEPLWGAPATGHLVDEGNADPTDAG